MHRIHLIALFALFLASCSDKHPTKPTEPEGSALTYSEGLVSVTTGTSTLPDGVTVTGFTADTSKAMLTKGVFTQFNVTIPEAIIKEIKKKGFHAFMVDMTCKGTSGKTFSYRNAYLPNLANDLIYPDKKVFFANAAQRTIDMHIPFRLLELSAGEETLNITLKFFPVVFKQDTSQVETKHLERISPEPSGEISYTVKIQAPVLKQIEVKIRDMVINPKHKDPHKYDIAFGGSGYPDPYWQLWCGQELIYYSPSLKNSLTYAGPYTSDRFYLCEQDQLTLHFLDYDKGPFNQDDEIEHWEGYVDDLKQMKNFQQGNISACAIEVMEK